MGVEHSQQRPEADGRAIFEGPDFKQKPASALNASLKKRSVLKQTSNASVSSSGAGPSGNKQIIKIDTDSPTTSGLSRPPSPPLSVCSDLPYVSYTDRPIGDSPKLRNKAQSSLASATAKAANRKSHPTGTKPKRPQSTISNHSIVVVKPGTKDADYDIDPELQRLQSIPQFLPVLRNTISSATFTKDPEILDRLHSQHFVNICSRMAHHYNLGATHVAQEQNHLVERTKVVSNSITTLFATYVDMQKTYASFAEHFAKIKSISEQVNRCNILLNENLKSLEEINNFLDVEDRLEPFTWRTDDKKLRGEPEGTAGGGGGRIWRS